MEENKTQIHFMHKILYDSANDNDEDAVEGKKGLRSLLHCVI
jgi:hypothetical protein